MVYGEYFNKMWVIVVWFVNLVYRLLFNLLVFVLMFGVVLILKLVDF